MVAETSVNRLAGVTQFDKGISTNEKTGEKGASGKNALGKQAFLHLLTTQLQYQDPLKPMESTEFVAQLAQFRELEAAMETNKTLTKLAAENRVVNNLSAAGLLGQTVEVSGGTLSHTLGQSEILSYSLESDAVEVTIHVKDKDGNLVTTLTSKGEQGKGSYQTTWDGRDISGVAVPAGEYSYDGTAKDKTGKFNPIKLATQGAVTGVSYEEGGPFFTVNGTNVPVAKIVKVIARTI